MSCFTREQLVASIAVIIDFEGWWIGKILYNVENRTKNTGWWERYLATSTARSRMKLLTHLRIVLT